MNARIIMVLVVAVAAAMSASATYVSPWGTVQAHVVDQDGNALSGVAVAPEWKGPATGWNDYFPQERTSGADGIAKANTWITYTGKKLQVNRASIEGYSCTSGAATQIVAVPGVNTLEVVCVRNPEVPEFSVLAAGLVMVAGVGLVIARRR